jgi:hypothetical protein
VFAFCRSAVSGSAVTAAATKAAPVTATTESSATPVTATTDVGRGIDYKWEPNTGDIRLQLHRDHGHSRLVRRDYKKDEFELSRIFL